MKQSLLFSSVLLLALVCLVTFFRAEVPFAELERGDILRIESRCMMEIPRDLTEEQMDDLIVLLRQVRLHHRIFPANQTNGSLHRNCMFTLFMADGSQIVIGAGDGQSDEFVLNDDYWRADQKLCQAIHAWYAKLWEDSGWILE